MPNNLCYFANKTNAFHNACYLDADGYIKKDSITYHIGNIELNRVCHRYHSECGHVTTRKLSPEERQEYEKRFKKINKV